MKEVYVPNLGVNDVDALLIEWVVENGEEVHRGIPVAILETTKATIEVESDGDGFLYHNRKKDDSVPVGSVLAWINDVQEAPKIESAEENEDLLEGLVLSKKAEKMLKTMEVDLSLLPRGVLLKEKDVCAAISDVASVELSSPSSAIKVAIYGAGMSGEVALQLLRLLKIYDVACFLDDMPDKIGSEYLGCPVYSGAELDSLPSRGIHYCVSHIADRIFRWNWLRRCEDNGITPLAVIHPDAFISPSVKIGRGCFIKAGAVIETGSVIGDGCIVDNGVVVPHHVQLGNCVHFAPGVNTGGKVTVGDRTLLGVGCVVSSFVNIGNDVMVSPGAVIDKDIESGVVVGGNPCKILGANKRVMIGVGN